MKNSLKSFLLLGALSALLVGLGSLLGPKWAIIGLAAAGLMNFFAYFFSDRVVLALHRAQEVDPNQAPWLHEMVEELAQRAQIPKPRVYIIPSPQPNAFATGRNPAHGVVAVTEGIMQILDRRELRGVLAHELGHIKNRDILLSSVAAMIVAAITHIAHWGSFAAFGGGGDDEDGSPVLTLVLLFTAPLLAMLVQLGISRSREYLADQAGAEISGDPEALARALEKLEFGAQRVPAPTAEPATASLFIVNPLRGGALLKLFSTHPSTAERAARLRAMSLGAASQFGWSL